MFLFVGANDARDAGCNRAEAKQRAAKNTPFRHSFGEQCLKHSLYITIGRKNVIHKR